MKVRGIWYFRSESNSRWNLAGSIFLIPKMRSAMPESVRERYKSMIEKYGNPPEDLEWGAETIYVNR